VSTKTIHHLNALDLDLCKLKQRRKRKVTLSSIAKQVAKAGLPVKAFEYEGDKITVVIGKPEAAPTVGNDLDQWLEKRRAN
jgi:hypothetical protein